MIYTVCTLLLLASSAIATQLCLPDQVEGVQLSTTGFVEGHNIGLVTENTTFHYDYLNRRFASVTVRNVSGVVSANETVIIPNLNGTLHFVKDLITGNCSVHHNVEVEAGLQKLCLPVNAQHVTDGYLGPYGILKVSIYNMTLPNMNVTAALYINGDIIIPVSEVINGTFGNMNFLTGMNFYNVTSKIQDKAVFNQPSGCQHETHGINDSHLHRKKRSFFGV